MSTCTTVRDALPGIAAGEPDEVGADRHLESCAGCRAEREALKRDVGSIRGGLAALDPAPDVVTGRGRVRAGRGGARSGSRVLSWWTVGVGLAAVVLVGFLVGRALHERQEGPAGSPAAPGDAPARGFSDVSAIVARGDAPRVVHIRIEADGETRLRWLVRGPDADWVERGPWRLGGPDPAEQMTGLRELPKALAEACPDRLPASELHSTNAPRLIVDVDPRAAWRIAQLVLPSAVEPPQQLVRITYMAGAGVGPLDIDLPGDRSVPGVVPPELFGDIRLFRKRGYPERDSTWTQIRGLEGQEWNLPLAVEGPETEQAASRRVSEEKLVYGLLANMVAASIKRAAPVNPVAIMIKTPPPTGGLVPAGDVLHVAATLRRAGIATIWFEGAPAPRPEADRGNRWEQPGSEPRAHALEDPRLGVPLAWRDVLDRACRRACSGGAARGGCPGVLRRGRACAPARRAALAAPED